MKFLLCSLCLAAACCAGCAQRPLTDSEFRGFCYTLSEGRNASCDNIVMCDTFDTNAVSMPHKSKKECTDACQAVYDRLYEPNLFISCSSTLRNANGWCFKYCETNYPQ
jgi:hypothetical protein